MSVETPPFAVQAGSYGAEQLRRAIGSLLPRGGSVGSVAGGLVAAGDMAVTAGGGMSVNVGTGEAWVPGSSSTTQGGYYSRVTSSTNVAVSAANGSNPRIDLVAATVADAGYSGASNSFSLQVVAGTPAAGATLSNLLGAPSLPTSSLLLAYILVPAGSSSVSSGNILNSGLLAAPQTLFGTLATRPTSAQNGTRYVVYGDTVERNGVEYVYNGAVSAWVTLNGGLSTATAVAYATGSLSWTSSEWLAIPYNQVEFDPYGLFDTSSGAYTCPSAGVYRVDTMAPVTQGSTTGPVVTAIYKNGSTVAQGNQDNTIASGTLVNLPLTTSLLCASGDLLTTWVYAKSGAVNTGVGQSTCRMAVSRTA